MTIQQGKTRRRPSFLFKIVMFVPSESRLRQGRFSVSPRKLLPWEMFFLCVSSEYKLLRNMSPLWDPDSVSAGLSWGRVPFPVFFYTDLCLLFSQRAVANSANASSYLSSALLPSLKTKMASRSETLEHAAACSFNLVWNQSLFVRLVTAQHSLQAAIKNVAPPLFKRLYCHIQGRVSVTVFSFQSAS